MIPTGTSGGNVYANNDTIATPQTAQLCAAGAEATTFTRADPGRDIMGRSSKATSMRWILITHATGDIWIAKDTTTAAATAGGALNDRIFIAAGTTGLVLPWSGLDVCFLNAVTDESPSLYVVGWY